MARRRPGSRTRRFRNLFPELAGELGFFAPGPLNSITDVAGVRVGQASVRDARRGLATGVTAIWPREDVYAFRPRASGHVLHGAGEMTGLHQALEWGLIETPILLTSTLNVGRVYDGAIEYLARRHPRMGLSEDVLIPIVAECDDSHLSRARLRAVGTAEVRRALDAALRAGGRGPVAEGAVGAGTGMVSFDFKGGIGTSSRVARLGEGARARSFTVGALVNANVGMRRQLRLAGRWVGRGLQGRWMPGDHPERSIIVILATDAPLRPDQLRRLSVRAGLGLGRAGSFAGHGSGEIVLAFSTTLGEPRAPRGPMSRVENLHDTFLNPLYEATVECVEECLLNALVAGSQAAEPAGFAGRDGHLVHGLPIREVREMLGMERD